MLDRVKPIADVQSTADKRNLAIDRVGIRNLRHPVRVSDRSGPAQHTVACCDMYVKLPHQVKGTHMSRFVEILNARDRPLSVRSFQDILPLMTERLEVTRGHVEIRFPYFVDKRSPVSGVASLLDYEVAFIGEIAQGRITPAVRVLAPVTSLCPCSKEIADYGAHNQRSHVTVTARLRDTLWIEDLIDVIESEASCEVYGLLKRADEKFVTERAYDNPKFVEDLVRDVALRLSRDRRISRFSVEAENFESIHNHSAYARIESQ